MKHQLTQEKEEFIGKIRDWVKLTNWSITYNSINFDHNVITLILGSIEINESYTDNQQIIMNHLRQDYIRYKENKTAIEI